MELHLAQTESALLQQVLRNYLGDLRMEIRDTDSYTFREGLKEDERTIGAIIERLHGLTPAEAVQTP